MTTTTPGATYGHYVIQHPLGDGGFSQVFVAHDRRRNEKVALKLLDPMVTQTEEGRQRFLREVVAARRLSYRHIVPVYEAGIHDGRAFLAMRLMRGGTLADRLERTPILPPSAAAQVLRHTARALDHGRRLGVIHRDVKPSNIFYTEENEPRRVCLGDFGLAKVRGLATVTHMGQVIGSIYYMAPEQVQGLVYTTASSDIYALGVVLYEMLTGRLPFEGQSQASVLHAIVNAAPTRPSRHNPAISPEVEKVVLRALAKDPRQRFATAGQLAAAYQHAAKLSARARLAPRSNSGRPQPGRGPAPNRKPVAGRGAAQRPLTERPEFWVGVLAVLAFMLLVLYMGG